ncbi:MAG: heat-inducible transcription repressor HrcA [candidate division Zixibacteria bacterium]|nr:heat-inducible transcription repressor HrcA [candidate division Zixibacteria bacterium]
MLDRNLTDREKQVLQALIDHYVTTAKPVGSRTLATRYSLGISPATIRNTMSDLEDLGLITNMHTSSGRIPTDFGYRVYVDFVLKPQVLTDAERRKIKSALQLENLALGPILEQTSRVLAYISNQLGVSIAPKFEAGILSRITMVPVAEKRVLVVIAAKSGLVRSIIMEVETDLAPEVVEKTAILLTERLSGTSFAEIKDTIRDRLQGLSEGDPVLLELLLESYNELFSERFDGIHFEGASNLVKQPEFSSIDRFSQVVGLVEDRTFLAKLISADKFGSGTHVTIGHELESETMNSMSLVTSSFKAGKSKGILGVMGPTRMPYSRIVSVVDFTAKMLSKMLSK